MKILFKLLSWVGHAGKVVVDSKSEGEDANPFSVKVARWTTVAAAIGVIGVIFPIVWSTPPWWVEHKLHQQPMMAADPTAAGAAMTAAPESMSDTPQIILGVLVSLMAVSTATELWARHLHRSKRDARQPPTGVS